MYFDSSCWNLEVAWLGQSNTGRNRFLGGRLTRFVTLSVLLHDPVKTPQHSCDHWSRFHQISASLSQQGPWSSPRCHLQESTSGPETPQHPQPPSLSVFILSFPHVPHWPECAYEICIGSLRVRSDPARVIRSAFLALLPACCQWTSAVLSSFTRFHRSASFSPSLSLSLSLSHCIHFCAFKKSPRITNLAESRLTGVTEDYKRKAHQDGPGDVFGVFSPPPFLFFFF